MCSRIWIPIRRNFLLLSDSLPHQHRHDDDDGPAMMLMMCSHSRASNDSQPRRFDYLRPSTHRL